MAYEIGDPNHIGVHNALVTRAQAVADMWGATVTLPDTANVGDLGHTSDHNLIVTALGTIHAAIVAAGGIVDPLGPLPDTAAVSDLGHTSDHNLIESALAVVEAGQLPYNDATGGTVTEFVDTDTGKRYRVHEFLDNGTFVVNKSPKPFDVFLLGGGGSGGGTSVMSTCGGGGGGGGLLFGEGGAAPNGDALTLPAGGYPVVIGQGAAPGTYAGNTGGDTTFAGHTALGGGGGAGEWRKSGLNGGSGGGCSNSEGGQPGTGTAGQGSNGGGANNYFGGSNIHNPITIKGDSVDYGVGAPVSGWGGTHPNPGAGGLGIWQVSTGEAGRAGLVMVRYEIAAA